MRKRRGTLAHRFEDEEEGAFRRRVGAPPLSHHQNTDRLSRCILLLNVLLCFIRVIFPLNLNVCSSLRGRDARARPKRKKSWCDGAVSPRGSRSSLAGAADPGAADDATPSCESAVRFATNPTRDDAHAEESRRRVCRSLNSTRRRAPSIGQSGVRSPNTDRSDQRKASSRDRARVSGKTREAGSLRRFLNRPRLSSSELRFGF